MHTYTYPRICMHMCMPVCMDGYARICAYPVYLHMRVNADLCVRARTFSVHVPAAHLVLSHPTRSSPLILPHPFLEAPKSKGPCDCFPLSRSWTSFWISGTSWNPGKTF